MLGVGEHEHESTANHKPRDCCTAPGVMAPARQLLVTSHRLQPTDLWQWCRLCGCRYESRHGNECMPHCVTGVMVINVILLVRVNEMINIIIITDDFNTGTHLTNWIIQCLRCLLPLGSKEKLPDEYFVVLVCVRAPYSLHGCDAPWFICCFQFCINYWFAYLTLIAFLFTYLLSYLSTSSRIVSFHFRAGGRRRWPQPALVLCLLWAYVFLYTLSWIHVCFKASVVFGLVFITLPRDWRGRMSLRWPVLYQAGCKILT